MPGTIPKNQMFNKMGMGGNMMSTGPGSLQSNNMLNNVAEPSEQTYDDMSYNHTMKMQYQYDAETGD